MISTVLKKLTRTLYATENVENKETSSQLKVKGMIIFHLISYWFNLWTYNISVK